MKLQFPFYFNTNFYISTVRIIIKYLFFLYIISVFKISNPPFLIMYTFFYETTIRFILILFMI